MYDLNDLITKITQAVENESALALLHGKTYVGTSIGLTKPHMRLSLVGAPPATGYGHTAIDPVLVSFSVFSTDKDEACALIKAVNTLFCTGTTLALTGQQHASCVRKGQRILMEGSEAKNLVYHAGSDIEFTIAS